MRGMTDPLKLKDRTRGLAYVEPSPRQVGRPSSIDEEKVASAAFLAKMGATDQEIAHFTGVSLATVKNWYRQWPEFLAAIKEGKGQADERVERTLLQRATGFYVEVDQLVDGRVVKVQKYYPPDTAALIFWLKNRKPAEWKDKREIDVAPPSNPEGQDGKPSIRQLALGALALLSAAAHSDEPPTIDVTPEQRSTDAAEDASYDEDFEDGEEINLDD